MILTLAFALAAAALPASGEPATERSEGDKPFFIWAYENPSPAIREYRVGGIYGKSSQPFALSLHFRNGQWDVRVERTGQPPLSLRLDKAYNSIPINEITVATDGNDENLVALIPFGAPLTDCFANGADVYNRLIISTEKEEVLIEGFDDCKLRETSPHITRRDGIVWISPPGSIPGKR